MFGVRCFQGTKFRGFGSGYRGCTLEVRCSGFSRYGLSCSGFHGSGFSGFRVRGSGFQVRVFGSGFRGSEFWVASLGFGVSCSRFRV